MPEARFSRVDCSPGGAVETAIAVIIGIGFKGAAMISLG
jgi:hypothetical protein